MKRVLRGFLPVLILLLFSSGFLLRGDSGKANPFPDHILLTWTGDDDDGLLAKRSLLEERASQVRRERREGSAEEGQSLFDPLCDRSGELQNPHRVSEGAEPHHDLHLHRR